jgi:hypothetical protein
MQGGMTVSEPGILYNNIGVDMGFQAILDAVRDLPRADQVRLMHTIQAELALDVLEESDAPPDGFTPAMAATIQARLASFKADPSVAVPWADVEANVEKLLKELGE